MLFKDIWTDKIDGVDIQSAADINMIAAATIENEASINKVKLDASNNFNDLNRRANQNESDIKKLQENGGGSELFVIQWDGEKGDKTYNEVSQAIAERKIPVLYQGDKCIATFSGDNDDGSFVFAQLDLYAASIINEYWLNERSGWTQRYSEMVKYDVISANDLTFKTAVLNCFPDADEMSFPLEEAVSEVSEE